MAEAKRIYVVSHEFTELTKIGISNNPEKRIKSIGTTCGADLKVYYESELLNNSLEVERNVLEHFKEVRKKGEWVKESPEKVVEYIKSIEHTFNNIDYSNLEDKIEKEEEKVVTLFQPLLSIGLELRETTEKGVYKDENYKFYVTYTIKGREQTVMFNVFRTARNFKKYVGNRLIYLDLNNNISIKPKTFANYE